MNRPIPRSGFHPSWLEPACSDLEHEFREATREIGRIAGDALYGPMIAELDRKIAERDDALRVERVLREGER